LLSYPRTDTQFITENEFNYLAERVDKYKNIARTDFKTVNTKPQTRYVNPKKVEEHYAIIPTRTIPDEETINKLSEKQKNIYIEVVNNILGMFHGDYTYEETTVITNVKNLEFKTTGKVEIDKGWKSLYKFKNKNKKDDLPILTDKEEVEVELKQRKGKTSPPKPYT